MSDILFENITYHQIIRLYANRLTIYRDLHSPIDATIPLRNITNIETRQQTSFGNTIIIHVIGGEQYSFDIPEVPEKELKAILNDLL